jgi:hypothetical protein
VAENLPKTGAVGLNLMGGAGMFGVSIYMIFMGGYYDRIMARNLPAGANVDLYRSAPAGSDMARAFDQARSTAGPEILHTTMFLPMALIVAFGGLVLYMRGRKKTGALAPALH